MTPWKDQHILVFDTETTGLMAGTDRVIEFAYASYYKGYIHEQKTFLFNPEVPLSDFIVNLTGITNEMVANQPLFNTFVPHLEELMLQHPIVCGYNAIGFDRHFVTAELVRSVRPDLIPSLLQRPWLDPLIWARKFQKYEKGKRLNQVAERLGIKVEESHRALPDAVTCLKIMHHYMDQMPHDLTEALRLQILWSQQHESNYAEWSSKREEIAPEPEGT